MNKTSLLMAVIATFLSGIIICLERAFPFLIFSKRNPPAIIRFIEKFIPPMVMAALVVYCLKDMKFTGGTSGWLPYIAGVAVTAVLHLWKHNTLLSIFCGTAVYMFLLQFLKI